MSEIKHTPGPWTNHGRQTGSGLPRSAVAAKTLIAEVYSEYFGDSENETANASLIAAAPDLLECARLAKEFEQHAGGTHLPASAWFELHEKLDAAIAKATGVQS